MESVLIDYFRIDHERELNPNQESVIEEVREEIAEIKEWILQKQVAQEL